MDNAPAGYTKGITTHGGIIMCTALVHRTLFGRTLDLEYSYREQVVVIPRRFPFPFRMAQSPAPHHAIIGTAHVERGYPLLYDGVNEAGLAMAALNFPLSAAYHPPKEGLDNIAPFELIPWVLGQCSTVTQARHLLKQVNVAGVDFSPTLPSTPLHWLIADREQAITAEPMADGLHIYENPVGVLTNEPPFPFQLARLNDYLSLSTQPPENRFSPSLSLTAQSRGMGALGLPGDWSSQSRFVRCAFAAHNSSLPADVTHFFHIMSAMEVPRGCVRLENGKEVISVYTSCCDMDSGIYHYVTYENRQICAVDLHRENLDGSALISYPMVTAQQIHPQN